MFKHYLTTAAIRCACITAALVFSVTNAQAQSRLIEGAYVNEAQSTDGIKAAVNTTVASMNFLSRAIARKALEGSNPAFKRVVIAQSASEIVVTFDARKPIRCPADGSHVRWTSDHGDNSDVHASWKNDQLMVALDGDSGLKTYAFRLSDDHQTLASEVTITSSHFSPPLHYELTFHRQ